MLDFPLTLSFMILKNYRSVSFGETIQPRVKGIRMKSILICDQFKFKYEKLTVCVASIVVVFS